MPYFKVYRSSAGSGKTFTLTKEYLKLALVAPAYLQEQPENPFYFKPDYFRHILAITFTNDAAREMKHRILKDLGEIADAEKAKKNKVFEMLLAEIPTEFEDWNLAHKPEKLYTELQKRATELYRHILHYYSDFSVSTIDSFTNRLARSFNKDLDLPYNYEIELSTEDVITQAVYQLIEDADEKKNPELADLLVKFAQQRIEDEKSWQIDKLLQDFAKNIFDENKTELLKPLYNLQLTDFQEIEKKMYAYKQKIESIILKAANDAEALMQRYQFEKGDFYYGDYYNYIQEHKNFGKIIAGKDMSKESLKKKHKRLSESIENNKWLSKDGEKDVTKKSAMEHLFLQFRGIYDEIERTKEKEITDFIAVCDTLPRFYQLATLSEIGKRINAILAENTQATLSSLNEKIKEIVEESPVPYIYERIGEKYFHILIDEFQDTSKMQWGNLLPLVAHSLDMDRTSMVVGDTKQAIYRWRGGEAEILAQLPDLVTVSDDSPHKDAEVTLSNYFQDNNLASNRRSLKAIVEFNNHIFDFVLSQFPDYAKLLQHYDGQEQKPEYQRKDYEKGHIEIATFEHTEQDEYYKSTKSYIIENIQRLLNNGYNYGDIVLLVRKVSDAAYLSAQLVNHGIPITSDESLRLINSSKVRFIVNFISLLAQPLNPDTKADIIYFLADYTDLRLEKEQDETVFAIQAICNDPDLDNFATYLTENFGYAIKFDALQYLSLYEIGEELVRTFNFHEIVEDRVYLNALLDKLLSFGLKNSNNTLDFREYWKQKGEKLTVSMSGAAGNSTNAVKIMTIHKAKGLEFPVVMLPFADWTLKSLDKQLWLKWDNKIAPQLDLCTVSNAEILEKTDFCDNFLHEKQAAFIDNINVLYVALTRAKEQLLISCKKPQETKSEGKIDSINKLLLKYIEANEIPNKEETEHIFEVYQENTVRKLQKSQKPEILHSFISTECRDKIRIRKTAQLPEEVAAENSMTKTVNEIVLTDLFEARNKGNIIHKAFERVEYRTEIDKAVSKLISEGYITHAESKDIIAKMKEILQLPEIADLYEKKPQRRIFNERDLLVKPKYYDEINRVIRPDRVVIDDDTSTVYIIDYKTGQPNESHHTQIKNYAKQFIEMGFKTVEKLLVYTEVNKVVRVG